MEGQLPDVLAQFGGQTREGSEDGIAVGRFAFAEDLEVRGSRHCEGGVPETADSFDLFRGAG